MPRTPLIRPGEYFERRTPNLSLGRAFVVVLLAAAVTVVASAVKIWLFTRKLDFMITVQNPQYRPRWACTGFSGSGFSTPTGCGASKTMRVNLGAHAWGIFTNRILPIIFLLPFVAWVGAAVLAHVATTALDDADGSFVDTLAVSGWAAAPDILQALAASAVTYVQLRSITVPHDLHASMQKLQSLTDFGHGPLLLLVTLVVVAWKAYIWRDGLIQARNVNIDTATGLAAIGGLLAFIGAIVN